MMVLGEVGNFTAYAFAPASLVAPLGTTTVIGKLNQFLYYSFVNRSIIKRPNFVIKT